MDKFSIAHNISLYKSLFNIWHTPKEISELKNALHSIDKDLNKIRNEERSAFLQLAQINFSRVLHDYSDENKGFVIWKDDLEQHLT